MTCLSRPAIRRVGCTVRYIRRWYADGSRDVQPLPRATWESLTAEQRSLMRFPIQLRCHRFS
jgi:hypothetical protein